MATLPPLSEAGTLCNATSLVMRETGGLDHREPTVTDIGSFDLIHGSGTMPDPLLSAHILSRSYLIGAGDFVYSIGKILALEEPMVVSPAVLARSAAEYASRCKYLSSAEDSPEVRVAKFANLLEEGFKDSGANRPDADPSLVELARGMNDWKSRRRLPKVKLPNYSALVASLSPDMGKSEYDSLSGYRTRQCRYANRRVPSCADGACETTGRCVATCLVRDSMRPARGFPRLRYAGR